MLNATPTERAAMLDATLSSPGWQVVLAAMDAQVERARADLLECQSADPHVVHLYQLRARVAAEFARNLRHELSELARSVRPVPQSPESYLPGTD